MMGLVGNIVVLIVAGLAHAVAVANPWDGQPLWWLQVLALAVLVWQLHRTTSWQTAAFRGGLFATAWLAGAWWWLFTSMHTYGGLAAPIAAMAVLALAAFLALYYAAASAIFWRLHQAHPTVAPLLFATSWTLAELARVSWFTGFPWAAGGYAHVDGPLAALAPWVGVHGIGWVAAWLAATLLQIPIRPTGSMLRLVVMGGIVGAAAISGPWSGGTDTFSVTLLQGNISQDEKFQSGTGVPMALRWYGQQLVAARTDLVVAPETAIPLLPQQLPEGYWAELRAHFSEGPTAALIGVPLGNFQSGYTNSVLGLQPGQALSTPPYRFDKHHLVPFGEFIPPLFRWFTDLMNIPLGDFNRGALGQPVFTWRGQRFAPHICYEDLFGEELAVQFLDSSQAPTVLVNISNIAWFGDSLAIDQHLQISRMRAMEFERPLLRATNTGATVIIDHRGVVAKALPRLTQGVLVGVVEGRQGTTPYAWWVSRFGLWPIWGLGLAVLCFGTLRRRIA